MRELPKRLTIIAAALTAGAFAASPSLLAKNDEPSAKLGHINKQIDQAQSRRKVLKSELKALRQEERQISDRLIDLAASIQGSEAMISAGEKRIAGLDRKHDKLRQDLARRRSALTELLAGLQRLERNRPPPLATRPDDAVAAIRGAMLFGAVVPAVNRETVALARTLSEMDSIRARRRAEQSELRQHTSRLDRAHREMADLQVRKAALIGKTGADLKDETLRLTRLARKARSLKQLMRTLSRDRRQKQAEEAERKALEERNTQFALQPFSRLRGEIEYPVNGRLVRSFGAKDRHGKPAMGIYIATRSQGQVTSPASGRVEYAGDFRSYGKLLILDVGEGYHVVLAGLQSLAAKTGHSVRAGEPIGRMGRTSARGTLIGESLESDEPILYVEFRVDGRAVDSSPWWIANRKEARR